MANKYLFYSMFLLCFFFVPQKSNAQSPEELLKEMRSINPKDIAIKEYYAKLFPYYDTPSRELLHHYLQSSADELNMSLDDYYKVLDSSKSIMLGGGVSFDMFTNLMSSKNFENLGFSNYSQIRNIDNKNLIEIKESADLDINKYIDYFVKEYPGVFDSYSTDMLKEILIDKLPENMYQNGKLIYTIIFVKENGAWKIHISKQQADSIFPDNNYKDKMNPSENKNDIEPNENHNENQDGHSSNKDEKENGNANEMTPANPLKTKVEDLLAQAQQFEKDKDISSAAKQYKQIVDNYPASKYAEMSRKKAAIDFFQLKQYNEVINTIQQPDWENKQTAGNLTNLYNYLLGMSYYLKEKPDYNNVVFYLEKVIQNHSINKNTRNALSVLGICYENMQHYNEAIETYKKIYNIHDTKQSKALYKIGELYSLKNEFDMSNKYLTQYLRDFPNSKLSDIANYRLGKNHFSNNPPNYDSAIVFFHAALSNTTDQELIVKSNYYLGECYFKLKQWDACKASFSKVMKAPLQYNNPDEFARMRNTASIRLSQLKDEIPKDYYHRGIAALDSSEYQKAFEYFHKLIERDDRDYLKQSVLKAAWCKLMLKKYDDAYNLLNKKPSHYFPNDEIFQFVNAICLVHKRKPDYFTAIFNLKHLDVSKPPSSNNKNLITYSIGLCYEKKGDKEQESDKRQAIDDYVNAKDVYVQFIETFTNDNNYSVAKKAIEKLKQKIPELEQYLKDNKIYQFGNFYTYKRKTSNDTLIITIVDLLKNSHLQPDGNPGILYIPVNISKVLLHQEIKLVINMVPFDNSRLAYLSITTDVPRSKANVFAPSIFIKVSQDYQCLNGTNKIKEENMYGIWDEGFASTFKYSKPLTINFSVNSLGKSFHGSIGGQKKESPLFISIFMGNSANVVRDLIINAKKKGSLILFIAGMGTD